MATGRRIDEPNKATSWHWDGPCSCSSSGSGGHRKAHPATTEQWLLVKKAALLLDVISLAMHLLPFGVLRRLVDDAGAPY